MAIRKKSSGYYFIRVTLQISGKKRERKFTGMLPTVGAAKAKEQDLINELKRIKAFEEDTTKVYTWKRAVADYLDYSEENHRLSTFYNRQKVLEKYTLPWNGIEINEINRDHIKKLVEDIKQSVSFKKEVLKYIRQVFELACENKKSALNPARKIVLSDDKFFKSKASQLTAMTKSEVSKLFSYLREPKHAWYEIFFVTYHLGLRSSEAVALQFSDINFEKCHVVISKSWCKKKGGFVPPKNGQSRIVPINKPLMAMLKELKLQSTGPDAYVLPRIRSWMNGGATEILNSIQDLLEIKRTNYHSLRASFITHLLRNGLDVTRVQSMVGHRELSTTQRYIRLDGTDLTGVTESLAIDECGNGKVILFKESIES